MKTIFAIFACAIAFALILTSEAGRQRRDVDGEEGDKDGVLHIKVFKPKNRTRGDHGRDDHKLIVLNSTDSEDGKPQKGKIEKNDEGKFILETEDGTVVELKRVEKPKGGKHRKKGRKGHKEGEPHDDDDEEDDDSGEDEE